MIATRWGDSESRKDDEKNREFALESLLLELTGKVVSNGVRRSMKQHAIFVMYHKISKMKDDRIRQELIDLFYLELTLIDQCHRFKSAMNSGLNL
jgi:hypothetical protein